MVYRDPVGLPTVGYGHLVLAKDKLKIGDKITQARAEQLLRDDLASAERAVEKLVSVPISDNQFAALVSFIFNLGSGNLAKSTLLRKLNRRDYAGAAEQFGRWIFAGKPPKALPGLIKRRARERELFLKS